MLTEQVRTPDQTDEWCVHQTECQRLRAEYAQSDAVKYRKLNAPVHKRCRQFSRLLRDESVKRVRHA
jgi:hypothetical protein